MAISRTVIRRTRHQIQRNAWENKDPPNSVSSVIYMSVGGCFLFSFIFLLIVIMWCIWFDPLGTYYRIK